MQAIVKEHRDPQVLAEKAEPLREHGSNQHREESGGNIVTSSTKSKGNSSEYLTARIARDKPEILEEMKAGKFTSVRAAGKKRSEREAKA
jgi:hypothetical protein